MKTPELGHRPTVASLQTSRPRARGGARAERRQELLPGRVPRVCLGGEVPPPPPPPRGRGGGVWGGGVGGGGGGALCGVGWGGCGGGGWGQKS